MNTDPAWTALQRFERSIQGEARQRTGAFYTPPVLARAVVQSALNQSLQNLESPTQVKELRVLDPACGAGAMLLAAAEALATRLAHLEGDEPGTQHLQAVSKNLFGVDVDPAARAACQQALGTVGISPQLHVGDSLTEPLPETWPEMTAVVGNPPFLNTRRLPRKHPYRDVLKERYATIWQDKMDQALFFVWRGLDWAPSAAWVVPSAVFSGAKSQRFRTNIRQRARCRFLEVRNGSLFEDAAVETGLMVLERDQSGLEGWLWDRSSGEPEVGLEEVLEGFLLGTPVQTTVEHLRPDVRRWNVLGSSQRAAVEQMTERGVPLGDIFLVGKGMETGRNKAFAIDSEVVRELSEDERRYVQRRIRGRDLGRFQVSLRDEWLVFSPAAESLAELPQSLVAHLQRHEAELRERAAFRRGNCRWWEWTWPLHAESYVHPRVMTGYRGRDHEFAVVRPGEGIGLTDTTCIFVEDVELAYGLSVYLCSEPIVQWYAANTKHTGGELMEFFENQLRSVPMPGGNFRPLLRRLAPLGARLGERGAGAADSSVTLSLKEASRLVSAAFRD